MLNPISILQQAWKQAPAEPELRLGALVEVVWGNTTLTGVVTYGDPWLDDFGRTWFEVTGVVNGAYGVFMTKTYITDNELIRIIR